MAKSKDIALAADLHRVRAATTLGADANGLAEPEADLRRSLQIASDQDALMLELRAARDLAGLIAGRDDHRQAEDLLLPVRAAFTEGFATPDLIDTDALPKALR